MKIFVGEASDELDDTTIDAYYRSAYSRDFAPRLISALSESGHKLHKEQRTITVDYDHDKHGRPSEWMRGGKNHRTIYDESDKYKAYGTDVRDEDNNYWFVEMSDGDLPSLLVKLSSIVDSRDAQVVLIKHPRFDELSFAILGRGNMGTGLWW